MRRVLFVGEINVDLILGGLPGLPVIDREIPCTSCELTIGSSTAICACAYAALGGDASFMGLAGSDLYGDFMLSGMSGFGVKTDWVERSPSVATGITINLIVDKTRSQVTYPGSIAAFGREHIDWDALSGFDHVHLGGLYLQERLLPAVTELLVRARSAGLTTSLDPQWDSTEGWRHMDEWLPLLNWFFPNRDEAVSMTGAASVAEAVTVLAARTACPLVKDGAEGAWLSVGGCVRRIPGYPVEVTDTTGAGDTFDAAFLYGVLEMGLGLQEAARFANAAAARSCRFVGGVNARSTAREVLDFQKGRMA